MGIDPDTKVIGWAKVQAGSYGPHLVDYGIVKHLPGEQTHRTMSRRVQTYKWPEATFWVTEDQECYRTNRVNANNLIVLAHVAGAIRSVGWNYAKESHLVKPKTWKGQVPKGAHHCQILERVGWEYDFVSSQKPPLLKGVQLGKKGIPASRAKEVIDAIGIALWTYDNRHRLKRLCT